MKRKSNVIYYLPLEHIEQRYTKLLDMQLKREFDSQGRIVTTIPGQRLPEKEGKIKTGAFLDADDTIFYKASQLQQLCFFFSNGAIEDGTTFFVSDLWFPGIEAIKYMAHFHKVNVQIKGILWAGSWTETDYVRALESWAKWVEIGWIQSFDKIFLGSEHLRNELYEKGRILDPLKCEVTGMPFHPEDLYQIVSPIEEGFWEQKKEQLVVFPCRIDEEKQPWKFDQLEEEIKQTHPDVRFIKSMEETTTKKEYLELLRDARVVFSAALQENFGYSILEAAAYNCNLVLPRRLSYKEFFPDFCLYNSMEEAKEMVLKGLERPTGTLDYAIRQEGNTRRIVELV